MLARDVEREGLPHCAARSIGVIPYSPMQKGLLTDGFSRERAERLASDDPRKRDPQFQEPLLSANVRLVDDLKQIAGQNGMSVSQLAISWVLRRHEVTAAIVGARRPAQIEETVSAADRMISPEEALAIEDLLRRRQASS